MGATTGIEWADSTFNPWMGCEKVSPACANCYAERDTKRWGRDLWGKDAPRQVTSDANWRKPVQWNREAQAAGVRRRVFSASLADVFEDRRDLDVPRARLWNLIETTPMLDWLLLTKRPERIMDLVPSRWRQRFPDNVWQGTTVEDQERLILRVGALARVPARVRFLSAEPLLGPLDFKDAAGHVNRDLAGVIHWVIAGGESGAGFRPSQDEWIRYLRDQCARIGAAFFYKQGWGFRPEKAPLLDGVRHAAFPA